MSKGVRKRSAVEGEEDADIEEPMSPGRALLEETNKKMSKSALQMIKDYINNRRYNIRQ